MTLRVLVVPIALVAKCGLAGVSYEGVVTERVDIPEGETLTLSDPHDVTFAGGIGMTNATLAIESTVVTPSPDPRIVIYHEDSPSWAVFATNMLISTITNLTAKLNGSSFGKEYDSVTCFYKNYGNWISCQFQSRADGSSTVRCICVNLIQSGNDIKWYVTKRPYLTDPSVNPGERDLSGVTSYNSQSQVFLVDLTAHCCSTASFGRDSVNLSSPVYSKGGVLIVGGTSAAPKTLKITHESAVPIQGVINVLFGGSLEMAISGLSGLGGASHGTVFNIGAGGRLLTASSSPFDANGSEINADGAVLAFVPPTDERTYTDDSGHYVCKINLKNGSHIVGRSPRVRRKSVNGGAVWTVSGTTPSYCDTGIILWAYDQSYAGSFTLDVSNVTGDEGEDFIIGRSMSATSTAGYSDVTVFKTGDGTVRLNGQCDYSAHPTRIQGGTWLLGVSDAMHAGMGVSFEGGNLSVAEGTANVIGTVSVTDNGTISVPAGATLSFADSHAETWANGKRLLVNADLSETVRIRFGTTSDGLTRSQLNKIRLAAEPKLKRASLDADGYLTFGDAPGAVLVVR